MATNRELKAEIGALSEQRGAPPPDTDRLGRDALTKLVEQLRERVATGAAQAPPAPAEEPSEPPPLVGAVKKGGPAPDEGAPPPLEPAPAPPSSPAADAAPAAAPPPAAALSAPANVRYFVAEGRLIYTLKGKRGAFKPIAARELPGGQADLEKLLQAGDIVTFEQMMRGRTPKR
jgi:hypothetical protein